MVLSHGFILSSRYLALDFRGTIQKFPSPKSYQTLHLPCHSESDHFPKVILIATFGKNVRPLGNRNCLHLVLFTRKIQITIMALTSDAQAIDKKMAKSLSR